jgi:hypothetical protein
MLRAGQRSVSAPTSQPARGQPRRGDTHEPGVKPLAQPCSRLSLSSTLLSLPEIHPHASEKTPNCYPPCGIGKVGSFDGVGVRQCSERFFEGYAVLLQVDRRFSIVPFEITNGDRRHVSTILTRVRRSRQPDITGQRERIRARRHPSSGAVPHRPASRGQAVGETLEQVPSVDRLRSLWEQAYLLSADGAQCVALQWGSRQPVAIHRQSSRAPKRR